MRLRWDSVTASRGNPCRPLGSRSLNLAVRLPEATHKTVEQEPDKRDFLYRRVSSQSRLAAHTIRPVTREGTRRVAVLAIAVLAALLLAACGGSDSTTTSSTDSTEAGAQGGARTDSTTGSGPKKAQGGNQKAKDNSGNKGGGSNYDPEPLRVSGGGSSQFLTKGGDNSIQEFGGEADESELTQAAEVLHAFLVARADEDWSRACTYLTKGEVQQLEQLGSQSPQLKGKGCPAVIKALAAEPLPTATKRELTEVDAASLRIEGEEAFLIYNGPQDTGYFVRMENEDGTWRVGALSPTAFP
jgi:hypothetical protein